MSVVTGIRKLLEIAISWFGYELKVKGQPLRGYEGFLAHVKRRGLIVNTVFDGGVGFGTPWLYNAFPEAKIVVFEPLDDFLAVLKGIQGEYGADYHLVALGSETGRALINVAKHHITSSSMKVWNEDFLSGITKRGFNPELRSREVAVVPLDDLNNYEPPYILKLDVEGYELEVLKGARRTLAETQLVILEVSVADRFERNDNFLEVYNFLDKAGFALYEIIDVETAGRDGPVSYFDVAFVPKTSELRTL